MTRLTTAEATAEQILDGLVNSAMNEGLQAMFDREIAWMLASTAQMVKLTAALLVLWHADPADPLRDSIIQDVCPNGEDFDEKHIVKLLTNFAEDFSMHVKGLGSNGKPVFCEAVRTVITEAFQIGEKFRNADLFVTPTPAPAEEEAEASATESEDASSQLSS